MRVAFKNHDADLRVVLGYSDEEMKEYIYRRYRITVCYSDDGGYDWKFLVGEFCFVFISLVKCSAAMALWLRE